MSQTIEAQESRGFIVTVVTILPNWSNSLAVLFLWMTALPDILTVHLPVIAVLGGLVVADMCHQSTLPFSNRMFPQVVEKERQSAESSLKQFQAEYATLAEQRKKAAAVKEAQQQQARQKALAAEAMAKKQKQQQPPPSAAGGAQQHNKQQGLQPIGTAAVGAAMQAAGAPQQQQQLGPNMHGAGAARPAGVSAAVPAVVRGLGQLQLPQQLQFGGGGAMDEDDDFDMP